MELRDEVKGQFDRSHRLAKQYYDAGNVAKARVEYLKCAQFLKHLAQLSPPERKRKILERSRKFKEIGEIIREEVLKRDVAEGEAAEAAQRRVKKALKKKLRKRSAPSEPIGTDPPISD